MNNLNWNDLRVFLAAAQSGSLTGAAKLLGSNQPTIGRHIDNLEKDLGARVFQRSVKGLALTDAGNELLGHCREIEHTVLKITRSITDETALSGTVRVALPEGLCLELLTPQLPHFYHRNPEIRLILNVSANTADLTRGEADIAVRLFRPSEANLVVRRIGYMGMGLYASRAYVDSYGVPATLAKLRQHQLIGYGDQLGHLAENRWLLEHSGSRSPVLCSDSTSTRLKATIAGVGISVQPHFFARANSQLVALLGEVKLPPYEMWLVYHADLRQLARVRVVADFIAEQIKTMAEH